MSNEKTGGRSKGTLNKRTLEVLDVFGDFCPLEEILRKLKDPMVNGNHDLVISTCLKLMKLKFPERKAIESSVSTSSLSDNELIKEAAEILDGLGVKTDFSNLPHRCDKNE